MKTRSWKTVALGLAPLLAGCGPSMKDVGQDVLVSAPVWLLAGNLALLPFWLWWRRTRKGMVFDLRPAVGLATFLVVIAGLTVPWLGKDARSWLLSVLFYGGSGYLSVALLTWRVWLSVDPERACGWALLPALLLWIAPAIPLAAGWAHKETNPLVMAGMFIWLWLGSVGTIPGLTLGLVLLALVSEGLLRGRRRGRAPAPPEPGPLAHSRRDTALLPQEPV